MHSALYHGWLDHHRVVPRPHAFRYRLYMAYLDLSELDEVFRGRWCWSTARRALFRFDRRDHVGEPRQPLHESVRDLVQSRLGWRPDGPIRLLTHLRAFGYVFNPVSFYYCFDRDERHVQAVVAEVTNTPWGERHCYVLAQRDAGALWLRDRSDKAMHVSPFHPMALTYDWQFLEPGDRLAVHMSLRPRRAADEHAGIGADERRSPAASPIFGATLAMRRVPITTASLAGAAMRFPCMSARVVAAIHWEALRLWVKRVPVHDHPGRPPTRHQSSTRDYPEIRS